MILYHGTIMPVPSPLAHIGREELDFGKGFYLTKIKEQAEAWARKKMFIEHASRAVLNVYEFDSEAAIGSGISYLSMPQYDKEWLDFVVGNRKGHNHWRTYKVIEGGVANDRVIDTLEDYMTGRITAEQALGQLRFAKPNHQICILDQQVIDTYLHFVESVEIK